MDKKEPFIDKRLQKSELGQFFGINKECTNGKIFSLCREMQDRAFEQRINISNLVEVYRWLIEWKDSLIEGAKNHG